MRESEGQMVGEEEKANGHTAAHFLLFLCGEPTGLQLFPFLSPLTFFFSSACLSLVIHSGRTHVTLAFLLSRSLCLLSLPLSALVSTSSSVCVRAYCTSMSHAPKVDTASRKGNENWLYGGKWNTTACVTVCVSNMFPCRTDCLSFPFAYFMSM